MSALDTEYSTALIKAYVPEADVYSFDLALALASDRDLEAARSLEQDVTQLHVEEAARIANEALTPALDAEEETFIGSLWAEMVYGS